MRGNTVMSGYLKNEAATEATFAGGWLHTGDIAVAHKNGRIQIKVGWEGGKEGRTSWAIATDDFSLTLCINTGSKQGRHHQRRGEHQLHRGTLTRDTLISSLHPSISPSLPPSIPPSLLLQVENALHLHPSIAEVAVVAKPCDKWGEVRAILPTPPFLPRSPLIL